MIRRTTSPPAHSILATIAHPSSVVAGARRPLADPKGKGKQKVTDVLSTSSVSKKRKTTLAVPSKQETKKQQGRAASTANYTDEDLDVLFNILEVQLPLGGHAWNSASDDFNAWAEENSRLTRTAKSLELKFKQVYNLSTLLSLWQLTMSC